VPCFLEETSNELPQTSHDDILDACNKTPDIDMTMHKTIYRINYTYLMGCRSFHPLQLVIDQQMRGQWWL
jgi:hypothetical protein